MYGKEREIEAPEERKSARILCRAWPGIDHRGGRRRSFRHFDIFGDRSGIWADAIVDRTVLVSADGRGSVDVCAAGVGYWMRTGRDRQARVPEMGLVDGVRRSDHRQRFQYRSRPRRNGRSHGNDDGVLANLFWECRYVAHLSARVEVEGGSDNLSLIVHAKYISINLVRVTVNCDVAIPSENIEEITTMHP